MCKFCSRQTCDRHSLGRCAHPQTQQLERICDLCDQDRVGGHLKTQLRTYIAQLKETKVRLKAEIAAQKEEWEVLDAQVEKLSKETGSCVQNQSGRLSILESRISIETSSIGAFTSIGKGVKESISCSQAQLEESQAYIQAKLSISHSLRQDISHLHEEIRELEAQADEQYQEARDSVARTRVSSLICPNCTSGLQSLPPRTDPADVTLGWNRTVQPAVSHKACSSCALM